MFYQTAESVDRNEGIVSMVVITALNTIANDTQTFRAKAALLEDGSSNNKNNRRLRGFYKSEPEKKEVTHCCTKTMLAWCLDS